MSNLKASSVILGREIHNLARPFIRVESKDYAISTYSLKLRGASQPNGARSREYLLTMKRKPDTPKLVWTLDFHEYCSAAVIVVPLLVTEKIRSLSLYLPTS